MKKDSKIYDYLKQNPSLIVALSTFIIGFIAAACKMIEYIKLKMYLEKFGYDISYVKTDSISNIYVSVSYIVVVILLLISFVFLVYSYLVNIKEIKIYAAYNYGVKITIKNKLKNIFAKCFKKDNDVQNSIKECNMLIKRGKQNKRKSIKSLFSKIIINVLVYFASSYIAIFIFSKMNELTTYMSFMFFLLWVATCIVFCYLIYLNEYHEIKKIFKEANKKGKIDEKEINKYLEDKIIKEYSSFKEIFTDENIMETIKFIIVVSAMLMIVVNSNLINKANNTIDIVNINNKNYLVTYKTNDNIYYLNALCIVDENTIEVFKNSKAIIQRNEIEIVQKEYKKINIK